MKMRSFPIHTVETAPEASKPSLQALRDAFGFIPNIAGAMATSPVLIGCLTALFGKVHGGGFAESEIPASIRPGGRPRRFSRPPRRR